MADERAVGLYEWIRSTFVQPLLRKLPCILSYKESLHCGGQSWTHPCKSRGLCAHHQI